MKLHMDKQASVESITEELMTLYKEVQVTPDDERVRLKMVTSIERELRRNRSWKKCSLALFGSSLSRFGSKQSDLDVCLSVKGDDGKAQGLEGVSVRGISSMIKQSTQNAKESAAALKELEFQVHRSLQKISTSRMTLEKALASKQASLLTAEDGTEPNEKKKAKHMSETKELAKLEEELGHVKLHEGHLALLHRSIREELEKQLRQLPPNQVTEESIEKDIKTLIRLSRERTNLLFQLSSMLERKGYAIQHVISTARIPVIRFRDLKNQVDFDLCLENKLAQRNTRLLRAYAGVDERLRILGIAVKYWAKARGVSDASAGYLSSYSYILLVIYYFQVVVNTVPSLQDEQLLAELNISPEMHDGVNIAFCGDEEAAKHFHQTKCQRSTIASNPSASELLLGFFDFFANHFNFADHVVSIRKPYDIMSKTERWGKPQVRSWRISIEDPLEANRDLGCVLQFTEQHRILNEFERAYLALKNGSAFRKDICEPHSGSSSTPPDTKRDTSTTQSKQPTNVTHIIRCFSDVPGLTIGSIKALVGELKTIVDDLVVVNVKEEGKQQWKVSVNMEKSKKKAKFLGQKTVLIWQHEEHGSYEQGFLWLHHVGFRPNRPCTKCYCPSHASNACREGTARKQHQIIVPSPLNGAEAQQTCEALEEENLPLAKEAVVSVGFVLVEEHSTRSEEVQVDQNKQLKSKEDNRHSRARKKHKDQSHGEHQQHHATETKKKKSPPHQHVNSQTQAKDKTLPQPEKQASVSTGKSDKRKKTPKSKGVKNPEASQDQAQQSTSKKPNSRSQKRASKDVP